MSTHNYDRTAAAPGDTAALLHATQEAWTKVKTLEMNLEDARKALQDLRGEASKLGLSGVLPSVVHELYMEVSHTQGFPAKLSETLGVLVDLQRKLKLLPWAKPAPEAPTSPMGDHKPLTDMSDAGLNRIIEALVSGENLWMDGEVSKAQMPARMRQLREQYRRMPSSKQQKMYQEYINGETERY